MPAQTSPRQSRRRRRGAHTRLGVRCGRGSRGFEFPFCGLFYSSVEYHPPCFAVSFGLAVGEFVTGFFNATTDSRPKEIGSVIRCIAHLWTICFWCTHFESRYSDHCAAICFAKPGYDCARLAARSAEGASLFWPLSVWFDQRGRLFTKRGTTIRRGRA